MVIVLRELIWGLSVLFIISMAIFLSGSGETASVKYGYTGVKVCRECHGEEAIGDQYRIWAASPHSKAFLTLTGEKAEKIAAAKGFSEPQKNYECLKCHATGGGKWPAIKEEGVGCESCHGPGGEYYTASNHVDYESRENGYKRAVRLGMFPILGIASLKTREKLCLSCHTAARPCYDEKTRNPYKYKIPIQTVDSLMKDNVDFRHPLRR